MYDGGGRRETKLRETGRRMKMTSIWRTRAAVRAMAVVYTVS